MQRDVDVEGTAAEDDVDAERATRYEADEDALKPDFGLSGALAKDEATGRVWKGHVLKWSAASGKPRETYDVFGPWRGLSLGSHRFWLLPWDRVIIPARGLEIWTQKIARVDSYEVTTVEEATLKGRPGHRSGHAYAEPLETRVQFKGGTGNWRRWTAVTACDASDDRLDLVQNSSDRGGVFVETGAASSQKALWGSPAEKPGPRRVDDARAFRKEVERLVAKGSIVDGGLKVMNYGFSDHAAACAHEALLYLDGISTSNGVEPCGNRPPVPSKVGPSTLETRRASEVRSARSPLSLCFQDLRRSGSESSLSRLNISTSAPVRADDRAVDATRRGDVVDLVGRRAQSRGDGGDERALRPARGG